MQVRVVLFAALAAAASVACGTSSDAGGSNTQGGSPFGSAGAAGSSPSGGDAGSAGKSGSGTGGAGTGGMGAASAGVGNWGSSGAGGTSLNGASGAGGGSESGGSNVAGSTSGGAPGGAGASGSSSGGASSAGAAGSAGYQPCPTDGSPCKVLPLGDSITWGVGDEANGGYRGPLFAQAVAAQKKLTFTGSLSNGPSMVSGQTFPKRNEGHSGWTISMPNANTGGKGISGLIPSPAFSSGSGGTPDIILMMIGTNDTGSFTGTQIATQLSSLLDQIIGAAPDSLLVVAKITPISYASAVVKAYNDAIPGLVQTRATAGKHILLADMNTGFDSATMFSSDNLHPNSAGYKFMASRWYAVVGPLLRP